MKELFHIQGQRGQTGQEILSLRVGEKHFSYAISSQGANELYELVYCSLDGWNEEELSQVYKTYPQVSGSFYQVLITYDNPQALIMPSWCYRQEDSVPLLRLMHGSQYRTHVVSEMVPGWQLYNIYRMPMDVQDWMSQQFPRASFRHQYSLALKTIPAASSGCLMVDFRSDDITVLAAEGGKLLLAQTFVYSTPEDVVYFLLAICQRFSLSQEEVLVKLSGLIDKGSALFMELTQYFINVELRTASWKSDTEYPAQFFTSLNDLAVCAS